MAQLNIFFIPPATPPSNGYRVRYRVKGSLGPYTTIPVNPTSSPAVVTGLPNQTDYEGTVESDCGGGLYSAITNFNTTTCFCAIGYIEAPDHGFCYKLDEVSANPPTGGGDPEDCVAAVDASYTQYGAYIYSPGFNINGTGPSTQINNSNAFWINPSSSTSAGPLNRSGLWVTTPTTDQDIGFAVCITLTESKLYYIGIAGDNQCIIKLDSNTIVEQDIAALGVQYAGNSLEQQIPFKVWHIYPVAMSAGPHIIEVIGHNISSSASLGAEVYDATPAELIAATSYPDLGAKLIFSTKDFIGQPVQLGTGTAGYTCPPNYALKSCVDPPVCVRKLSKACGDFS